MSKWVKSTNKKGIGGKQGLRARITKTLVAKRAKSKVPKINTLVAKGTNKKVMSGSE